MSTDKPPATISETLRRAIAESGASYKGLSRETGVARASLMRFVTGRQSLRLDVADRLAEHFGFELQKRAQGGFDPWAASSRKP